MFMFSLCSSTYCSGLLKYSSLMWSVWWRFHPWCDLASPIVLHSFCIYALPSSCFLSDIWLELSWKTFCSWSFLLKRLCRSMCRSITFLRCTFVDVCFGQYRFAGFTICWYTCSGCTSLIIKFLNLECREVFCILSSISKHSSLVRLEPQFWLKIRPLYFHCVLN